MILNIALTLFGAWLFTEFVGYFLHKLLHSEKIQYLSRSHMIHHLRVYGPNKPLQAAGEYQDSIANRAAFFGIGMEWIGPILLIIAAVIGLFYFFNIPITYGVLFLATSLGYGYIIFSYMHDRLHVKDFWMEKNWLFGKRFRSIRKSHDIHHMQIEDDGRMMLNFGICFHFFDVIFRTHSAEHKKFNKAGYEESKKKYSFVFD